MRRMLWGTLAAGALVLVGVEARAAEATLLPGVESGTSCEQGNIEAVDVVLLIDQSESLGKDKDLDGHTPLEQIEPGISSIGKLLSRFVDFKVNVGVVKFGETASVVLDLQPFDQDLLRSKATELGREGALEKWTDYQVGLDRALRMFEDGSSRADCRLLVWFTDGRFDLAKSVADVSDEPGLLRGAVCGAGAGGGSSLAARARVADVTSYAFLLQEGDLDETPDEQRVREASLEAMQAFTGAASVIGSAVDTIVTPVCEPYVSGDQQPTRDRGQVVVGSSNLEQQLFVLLNDWFTTPVGECPTTIESDGFTSEELPSSVFIERLDITLLSPDGVLNRTVTVEGVGPDDVAKTLISGKKGSSFSLTHDDLAGLAGGWKVKVSGPSNVQLCIQMTERILTTKLRVTSDQQQVNPSGTATFSVDWKSIGIDDPEGAIEAWTIEPIPGEAGRFEGSLDGADNTAILTPSRSRDGYVVRQVRVVITPKGPKAQQLAPLIADVDLTITGDDDAPNLQCAEGDVFRRGEVPDDGQLPRFGPCTLTSPARGTATLQSFVDVRSPEGTPIWRFVTEDGQPLPASVLVSGTVKVYLEPRGEFANESLIQNGEATLTLTWLVDPDGEPLLSGEETILIDIRLLKRADVADAIWLAIIIAAISGLLSLLLLRLITTTTASIPHPQDFYFVEVQVTIVRQGTEAFTWTPRAVEYDPVNLAPVRSDRPGRDLRAGRIQIRRTLPPLWRPFQQPRSEVSGAAHVVVAPSSDSTGAAPLAFNYLFVAWSDSNLMPRGADQARATLTLLLPRRRTDGGLNDRQRFDIERMLSDFARSYVNEPSDQERPEVRTGVSTPISPPLGSWPRPVDTGALPEPTPAAKSSPIPPVKGPRSGGRSSRSPDHGRQAPPSPFK